MRVDQVISAHFQDKQIEKIFYQTKLLYEHNDYKPVELEFPLNIFKTDLIRKRVKSLNKLEFIYYKDFFDQVSPKPSSTQEYIVNLSEGQVTQKDFYLNKSGTVIFYLTYVSQTREFNGWIVSATKKIIAKNNKIDLSLGYSSYGTMVYKPVKEIKFNNLLKLEFPNQPADLSKMFYNWYNLTSLSDIQTIGIQKIGNLQETFYNCTKLQSIDSLFDNIELSEIKSLKSCFEGCKVLRQIDLSNIRLASNCDQDSLNQTFKGCNITNINEAIQYINTNYLTKLESTFANFYYNFDYISVNANNWWNPLILNEQRFIPGTEEYDRYCELYPGNDGWINSTFRNEFADEYLSNIINSTNLNLENKDFSNITSIEGCFYYSHFNKIYLSNLDTSNLINVYNTFAHCTADEIIGLDTWNTQNITSLESFLYFANINKIIDLRNNNFKSVINYYYSFYSPDYDEGSSNLKIKFDFDNNIWYNLESIDRQLHYSFGCDLSEMGNAIDFTKVFQENNLVKVANMFNHATIHTLDLSNKTFTTTTDIEVTDYYNSYGTHLKKIEYKGNFVLWKNNVVFTRCHIKNFYGNNLTLNSNGSTKELDEWLRNTPERIDGFHTYPILPDPEDNYNLLDFILSTTYIEKCYINNLTFEDYMMPWLPNTKEYFQFSINSSIDSSKYLLFIQGDFYGWEKSCLFESTLNELDLTGFNFPERYTELHFGQTPNSDIFMLSSPNKLILSYSNISGIGMPISMDRKLRILILQHLQKGINNIFKSTLPTITELDISNNIWGGNISLTAPILTKLNMSNLTRDDTLYSRTDIFKLDCQFLEEWLYDNTKLGKYVSGIILNIKSLGNNKTSLDLNDLLFQARYFGQELNIIQISCPTLTSFSFPDEKHGIVRIKDNENYLLPSNLNFINCKNLVEINRAGEYHTDPSFDECDLPDLRRNKNFSYMFSGCESLTNESIDSVMRGTWVISNTKYNREFYLYRTFQNCKSLTTGYLNDEWFRWSFHGGSTEVGSPTYSFNNIFSCFEGCENLTTVYITSGMRGPVFKINTNNFTNVFKDCKKLNLIQYPHYTNALSIESNAIINSTFLNCQSLTNIKLSGTFSDMTNCFKGCNSLTSLNLSSLTPIVSMGGTQISGAFEGCSSLTSIDLSSFTNMSTIMDISRLFKDCSSLTTIDLSNFATINNLNSMVSLFEGCSNLTNIDVSYLKTYEVINFESAFKGCTNLSTIDVSNFNTYNVSNYTNMFKDCNSLTNITLFNFTNGTHYPDLTGMFENCSSLQSIDFKNFIFDFTYKVEYASDGSPLLSLSSARQILNLFKGCSNLQTIYVDNQENKAQEKYEYLKTHEFAGYEDKLNRYFNESTYNTIGKQAFEGCISLIGDNNISYQNKAIEDPDFFTTQQYATSANGYFTYKSN